MASRDRSAEVKEHESREADSDALLMGLLGEVLVQVATQWLLAHTCDAIAQIRQQRPGRRGTRRPGRIDGVLDELLANRSTMGGSDSEPERGAPGALPNLKYMQPKYRNVSSLMNYVDKDDGSGPKLVIMNFND